ncbi:hypothetical protein HDU76_004595, partial [Blyttiomyces sp. JEL0837]
IPMSWSCGMVILLLLLNSIRMDGLMVSITRLTRMDCSPSLLLKKRNLVNWMKVGHSIVHTFREVESSLSMSRWNPTL